MIKLENSSGVAVDIEILHCHACDMWMAPGIDKDYHTYFCCLHCKTGILVEDVEIGKKENKISGGIS